jgi:hypothetical protein
LRAVDDVSMSTSKLELRWRVRSGGGGRTERRYLDFLVDGISLYDRLVVGDQVGPQGSLTPHMPVTIAEGLD